MTNTDQQLYDWAIAGGGVTGLLAATRLAQRFPGARILLFEKEGSLGGALRSSQSGSSAFTSVRLWQFLVNTLSLPADEPGELPDPVSLNRIDILSAQKQVPFLMKELTSEGFCKALGGVAALEDWQTIQHYWEEDAPQSHPLMSLPKALKLSASSPALITMERVASLLGIASILHCSQRCVQERFRYLEQGICRWPVEGVTELLLGGLIREGRVVLQTKEQLLHTTQEGGLIRVTTSRGRYNANRLIIAQNPWDAMMWLDQALFPQALLTFVLKSKPDSMVHLMVCIDHPLDLPAFLLVPSEDVHALYVGEGRMVLQCVISYEQSLDAAAVVKGIKRLKRALAKITQQVPGFSSSSQHLALHPLGWGIPTQYNDPKLWQTLQDSTSYQTDKVVFCGSAYGRSFNPDDNIIQSLNLLDELYL